MWSYGVVILLPGGENGAGLGERRKERLVDALVARRSRTKSCVSDNGTELTTAVRTSTKTLLRTLL
jgi:hypothetical protein